MRSLCSRVPLDYYLVRVYIWLKLMLEFGCEKQKDLVPPPGIEPGPAG